jgi:hypothetical protein
VSVRYPLGDGIKLSGHKYHIQRLSTVIFSVVSLATHLTVD